MIPACMPIYPRPAAAPHSRRSTVARLVEPLRTSCPLYAVHPSRHHPPAKERAFIDFGLDASR